MKSRVPPRFSPESVKKMELVDTHAHLNFPQLQEDFDLVIKNAKDSSVTTIINVGTDVETSKQSIELAKKHKFIFPSCGIHPTDTPDINIKTEIEKLEQIASDKKIVGIGECGLDFYRQDDDKERKRQIELFKRQIEIAKKFELPVIVHSRDAWDETLKVIKETGIEKGVFHSWTYSPPITQQALKETNFYFAFNGIVTFQNAPLVQDSCQMIPVERLLLETDCPFLAPEPKRGLRNEPASVKIVAQKVADLKKISLEKIAQTTTKNALILFNIENLG